MGHFARFTIAVLGETLGGLLLSTLFIGGFCAAFFAVMWLLGNAFIYWAGITPPPDKDHPVGTVAMGMVPLMAVVFIGMLGKGIHSLCAYLARKWRETAQP